MPEGDVVARTAMRLEKALAGAPLVRAQLRWGLLDGTPLLGRMTLRVRSRGKHLLHRIEGGWTVHSHLRMEGSWRVVVTADATGQGSPARGRLAHEPTANPQVRAVFATSRWVCVGLRLGMLDLIRTTDEHTVVGHLGPDLLASEWDPALAQANLRAHPDLPIGQALLDQRLLAGIGTMYAAETLFLRRTYPWAPVGTINDDDLAALVETARRLMTIGTTQAVQSTTGSARRGEAVYVHARSGRPCRRCGDTVRVALIGDSDQARTMFSCPTCQGGLAPGDDGRSQRPLGSGTTRQRRPGSRTG